MSTYVYVSYPRKQGMRFDVGVSIGPEPIVLTLIPPQMDYYLNTHMALVDKHWRPFGLKSWTVIQFEHGDPSGMHCQTILTWSSMQDFEKAWDANIPELMTDLENYSDVVPVRWSGNVLKESAGSKEGER